MPLRDRLTHCLIYSPALALASCAGLMPDTFLDSPHTTIPHEAAFVIRNYLIIFSAAYLLIVLLCKGIDTLVVLLAERLQLDQVNSPQSPPEQERRCQR